MQPGRNVVNGRLTAGIMSNSLREFCGTELCIVVQGRDDRNERPLAIGC